MTNEIKQSFLKFQETGEPRWLGIVFDATASDLLAAAIHLANDADRAEDLVQATFLTAIDRAQDFDPERPLMPWLTGILSNHARNQRRSFERVVDQSRLNQTKEPSPLDALGNKEDCKTILTAVEGLEEPYRETLMLHLRHGLRPADIAHVLKEPPGTIRVRIHRGMERLKRTLPVGLASCFAIASPGLAQMKSVVLARAAKSLAATSTTAATMTHLQFGGLIMAKKMSVVIAIVLGVSLAIWVAREAAADVDEPLPQSERVVEASPDPIPRRHIERPEKEFIAAKIDAVIPSIESTRTLTGQIVSGESGEPLVGVNLEIHPIQRSTLLDVQRKWQHLVRWNNGGSPTTVGWPAIDEPIDHLILASKKKVDVKAPPSPDSKPTFVSKTGDEGHFKIPATEQSGILLCRGEGLSDRYIVIRKSDDLKTIKMWPTKRLYGVLLDEQGNPSNKRVHLSFCAYGADDHLGRWGVQTKVDGTFDLPIGATRVSVQCATHGYCLIDAFVRDGKRVRVRGSFDPGNDESSRYRIVLKKVPSIVVRDAKTKRPIDRVYLVDRNARTGGVFPSGHVLAPEGVVEIAITGGFMMSVDRIKDQWQDGAHSLTVWAQGYQPSQIQIEDHHGETEDLIVELQPGANEVLAGKIVKKDSPIADAIVSLTAIGRDSLWRLNSRVKSMDATLTGKDGAFELPIPSGQYLLMVEDGDFVHARTVNVPLKVPLIVDLDYLAKIEVIVKDSKGQVRAGHNVTLQGTDLRHMSGDTDEQGVVVFGGLAPATFTIRTLKEKAIGSAEESVDLREGETKQLNFTVLPIRAPVAVRLHIKGQESIEGWTAKWRRKGKMVDAYFEPDGVSTEKIHLAESFNFAVVSPSGDEWGFSTKAAKADPWEIHIDPNGRGYEGRLLDWEGKVPLSGFTVRSSLIGGNYENVIISQTDSEGRFKLRGLKKGHYGMSVNVPRSRKWLRKWNTIPRNMSIRFHEESSDDPQPLDIRLPILKRAGALGVVQIHGKVSNENGPMEGVGVFMSSVYDQKRYKLSLGVPRASSLTAKDGTYSVLAPASPQYQASISETKNGVSKRHGLIQWEVVPGPKKIERNFKLE